MEVTERNSRLVLVAGGVGLSGVLYNIISKVIKRSYSTFRINSDIPISSSQLFSSLLLSSFVVLLGLALIYCYFELFSYSNLKDEKKKWYLEQADRFYVYILRYFAVSFGLIILILTMYALIVEFSYLAGYIIYGFFIGISIMFAILALSRKVRNISGRIIRNLFGMFKVLFNETFFTITIASLCCWLVCFIFSMGHGIKSNTNANMLMTFDNENHLVTINYEDKIVDYFPESFLVLIENEGEIIQEIEVDSKDFKSSYVNVIRDTFNTKDRKEKESVINKNTFKYSYDVLLNQMAELNEGTIYIQFEKRDLFKKETYTIANFFVKKDSEYIFDFPEIDLDF